MDKDNIVDKESVINIDEIFGDECMVDDVDNMVAEMEHIPVTKEKVEAVIKQVDNAVFRKDFMHNHKEYPNAAIDTSGLEIVVTGITSRVDAKDEEDRKNEE